MAKNDPVVPEGPYTPRPVCFNCGYDVLGDAGTIGPSRCSECGAADPVKPRGITPWPSYRSIAWSLSAVGVCSGGAYLAVVVVGQVIEHASYANGAALCFEFWTLALSLLITFVYAVSIPDRLIERHATRRDRNRVYALLLAASFVLNLLVFVVVDAVSLVIHRFI